MQKQLILPRSVRESVRVHRNIATVDNAFDPSMLSGLTMDQFQATADSAGAFLIGELERFDNTLYEPLMDTTWARDIDLRTDATLGDDATSFGRVTYGATPGTSSGSRKAFIGKKTDALPGVNVDAKRILNPLTPWGMTLQWSVFELAAGQRVNRPVDMQEAEAMRFKYNMDIDEMVAVGDTGLGYNGMFNNASVTASNVVNGAGGSPLWTLKTPQEILNDVNTMLAAAWLASGYAVVPRSLRLPPVQFAYINQAIVSTAGNRSILNYLAENSLCMARNGVALDIQPSKWLQGAGAGSTNRMVAYTKRKDLLRYPMVPLARTPLQVQGIYQSVDYYCKLGVVEVVRPETMAYADGI